MKRLTERDVYDENRSYMICSGTCENIDNCAECDIFADIVDRLAAYEDTGLEPEEIVGLIAPPNEPLTLEELREMGGLDLGQLHIKLNVEDNQCRIVEACNGHFLIGLRSLPLDSYGKTWWAYRRKAEGAVANLNGEDAYEGGQVGGEVEGK